MYNFTLQITVGYNKILLPDPLFVQRGNLILISQGGVNLAMESSNPIYSDLIWQTTTWTRYNDFSNWRFFFKTMNNFTSFFNPLNVLHQYEKIGTYNVTISFDGSTKVFRKEVLVTDCKEMNYLSFYH